MPAPFADLIPDAREFLTELAQNNTRDWFAGNRGRYEDRLKTPAKLLLDQIAHEVGHRTGTVPVPKLFRPQRDVRFAKDKTPYHVHLHMMWTLPGPAPQPALFFGISPDYVRAGGGIMAFDKPGLTTWRTAMDGASGPALVKDLQALATQGFRTDPPDLKRVPAPYDRGHPQAELLRRKGLAVWRELPEPEQAAPLSALPAIFAALQPILDRLSAIFQND